MALAVTNGLTLLGCLLVQVQERAFKGPYGTRSLVHLLRQVSGMLPVPCDGEAIHRCQVARGFLATVAAQRQSLEYFPIHAPELNLVEGVWGYLKQSYFAT